jgi:hypothetical protein
MKKVGTFMRTVTIIVLVTFTASCATMLPKEFVGPNQAYDGGGSAGAMSQPPRSSYKKTILEAPYEDVYQALYTAATQAQVNIEVSDKDRGVILGDNIQIAQWASRTVEHHYYYQILVKETGSEQTEVTIQAKAQMGCEKQGAAMYIASVILIPVGLGVVFLVQFPKQDKKCAETSIVHWDKTSSQRMSQIFTFARNNLIAAGAL